MAIEALKQLNSCSFQNDKMTLSDVVQIYNASSLADLRRNLQASEAEAQKRMQAQQQQANATATTTNANAATNRTAKNAVRNRKRE